MRRLIAAALCGGLLAFTFLHPPAGWLIIFAFIPLLWLTQSGTPARAFLWGWAAGTAGFLVGFSWFYPVVGRLLHMNPLAAASAFFLLFAYHGLVMGLFAGATRAFCLSFERSAGSGPWALCAVPVYLTLEYFFPQFLPVSLADPFLSCLPSVQIAEFFGAAGPTALAMFSNAALYVFLDSARRRARGDWHEPLRWGWALAAVVLLLVNAGWGERRMREVQERADALMEGPAGKNVALLQGMIPLSAKFAPERVEENLDVYAGLTQEALASGPLDLIVWPQGAYERRLELDGPAWPPENVRAGGRPFSERMREDLPLKVPVLLSGLATTRHVNGRVRNYFAAWLVDERAELGFLTTKRHLTPFSEFVPFSKIPLAHRFKTENFLPMRRGPQVVLHGPGGLRLGAYMCYEEVVAESARKYAREGANLLTALSSNLQFGDSIGSELHLRYSVLRAVETRRYLARAVTSGVSAVITPTGRIASRLDYGRRGFLRARLALLEETTLYVRSGDVVYRAGAVLSLLLLLAARGRRKA